MTILKFIESKYAPMKRTASKTETLQNVYPSQINGTLRTAENMSPVKKKHNKTNNNSRPSLK